MVEGGEPGERQVSKAFTKEDDPQALMVTPRPPLPEGVPNYVTPRGLAELRAEISRLEKERTRDDGNGIPPDGDDAEARRLTLLNRRITELAARIGSASVVETPPASTGEVRFGATVTWRRVGTEEVRHGTIVGVDEADPAQGRMAFVAPIARALLGRTRGEVVTVRARGSEEELEILTVSYD
jgi:transcription elongation factor GreB